MNKDFGKRLADIIGEDRVEKLQKEAHIAAQIIKARHQAKMSQQELADQIGVAKSTIGRIEGGKVSPKASTLLKIASVLQIRITIDGTNSQENEQAAIVK